jgi:hypothetical protein
MWVSVSNLNVDEILQNQEVGINLDYHLIRVFVETRFCVESRYLADSVGSEKWRFIWIAD